MCKISLINCLMGTRIQLSYQDSILNKLAAVLNIGYLKYWLLILQVHIIEGGASLRDTDWSNSESKEIIEKASMIIATNNSDSQVRTESSKENEKEVGSYAATNIILNHDFSDGLHLWHPNSCDGFVVPAGSAEEGCCYAVVTNRKGWWLGLEQDITSRVSTGSTYTVSACVGASGAFQGSIEFIATLKLVFQNSEYIFQRIAK
ncbi:hypothetical protein RND71_031342 [Anisodus tanguticus]|uniref:CBM-cenC domain-containing protein n=1 Tax=Anisodus tanguticus TaxID=243964 RepID=A0AAE1RDF5_9SOLA|nr:hypothetical protein RND71_031342 [Anisodus tanguticus]